MKKEKANFDKKGRLNETKEVLSLRQLRLSYYTCLSAALADMPTLKELSSALSAHFQSGAINGRRGWYLRLFKCMRCLKCTSFFLIYSNHY